MKKRPPHSHHSTARFSDRVSDYLKYRPHYPADIIPLIQETIRLTPADRDETSTPFVREYERLRQAYCTGYRKIQIFDPTDDQIAEFFGTSAHGLKEFPNSQVLDLEGFNGRLLFSSYSPREGSPPFRADDRRASRRRRTIQHERKGGTPVPDEIISWCSRKIDSPKAKSTSPDK